MVFRSTPAGSLGCSAQLRLRDLTLESLAVPLNSGWESWALGCSTQLRQGVWVVPLNSGWESWLFRSTIANKPCLGRDFININNCIVFYKLQSHPCCQFSSKPCRVIMMSHCRFLKNIRKSESALTLMTYPRRMPNDSQPELRHRKNMRNKKKLPVDGKKLCFPE